MSEKASTQWDAVKFFTTLGYFGEIPFIGSFRWLQKWFGQSPTVAGKMLDSRKKKVALTGNYPTQTFELLQGQISPMAVLSTYQPLTDSKTAQANLQKVDTVVMWNSPDFLSLVAGLSTGLGEDADIVRQGVFDFTQADSNIADWGALDDVVMGGMSEGAFFLESLGQFDRSPSTLSRQHSAIFAGRISTQNSGGFSSVRTRNFEPPFNFSGWAGLWIKVKGDGQRYKFIVRNSPAWDSPAYVYIFDTPKDEWINIRIPFNELVPTFRAKSVPNAPPFNSSQAVSFQLMLSKFEYDGRLNPQFSAGPFKLAVAKIEAYRARRGVPLVIVGAPDTAARQRQQSALDESALHYRFIEPENQNLVDAIVDALN